MALTEIEKWKLDIEIAISHKKGELSRAKRSFQSQLNFMNKKDMPESFSEKLLNNACHWEGEIERLKVELDILSNVDQYRNFVPVSQRS